jgi:hypothetical protein
MKYLKVIESKNEKMMVIAWWVNVFVLNTNNGLHLFVLPFNFN